MKKLSMGDKAAPSRLNCWVDPAFADLPGESLSVCGRRRGSHVSGPSTEGKRPRKRRGEAGSSAPHTAPRDQRDQNEPWVDRHSPRSQTELAVHKKKIEEVENWMRVHTTTSQGGILLLTGPSGCGKTATIQVLSLQLGVKVQEWTNPTNLEPWSSSPQDWRMNGPACSQVTQFQDFLLRANKYNCLQMAGDGEASHRKLILVEDFPNQFYRQPGSLHDILRRFVKTSRCPLVFIVSDSQSGDSSSRFLFPRETQEELDMGSISFNPVAPTTMMKVLTRISTLEAGKQGSGKMCLSDQAVLESLCSGSSGDIRSAINSLQFSSHPDSSSEKGLWSMKKEPALASLSKAASKPNQRKKSRHTKEQREEKAIGGKDASLFLFRALGKILYCKREDPEGAEAVERSPGLSLPSHLSHHLRQSLIEDPELVVERSHMSGEFFSLYLHQNYLDFFSVVEDVERASDYLSDADLLTADWTSRSTMGDYGCSVATRGLLHSNSTQLSVGFRPLHKPNWLLISKKHKENCLAAQSLFRSFCLTPVSLQTELLPYLAKLTNPMRNPAQIAFIQDVGQMSLRRFPGRLKLEALTDKESGQLDSEEEEEKEKGEGGVDEGLPASQPQPTTSQVLLEEEDLNIEEYTSD